MLPLILAQVGQITIQNMNDYFIIIVTVIVLIVVAVLALIFGGRSLVWRGVDDPRFVYRKILSEINLMSRFVRRNEDETEAE